MLVDFAGTPRVRQVTTPPASPERPPLDSRVPTRVSTSAVKLYGVSKPKETATTRHR